MVFYLHLLDGFLWLGYLSIRALDGASKAGPSFRAISDVGSQEESRQISLPTPDE